MTTKCPRVVELEAMLAEACQSIESLISDLNVERKRAEGLRQELAPWAVLNPTSPTYRAWLDLLGDNACRLRSPYPDLDLMPDGPPRLFYVVDHETLDRPRFFRIVEGLAELWRVTEVEALRLIDEEDLGFRIPVEDVVICRDPREGRDYWLSVAVGRHVGKIHGEGANGHG